MMQSSYDPDGTRWGVEPRHLMVKYGSVPALDYQWVQRWNTSGVVDIVRCYNPQRELIFSIPLYVVMQHGIVKNLGGGDQYFIQSRYWSKHFVERN